MEEYTVQQRQALEGLSQCPDEASLWQALIAFQKFPFFTASGLPFTYEIKVGRDGSYNKELLIDRREKSKTLTFGSVRLAFFHALELRGGVVARPKALGDIRGVSYIYPLLWRFGMLRAPEQAEIKMRGQSL